jgi:hypothetical protein
LPHGYAMTIALGALIIHGVRFTHLPFAIDIATEDSLQPLWPLVGDLELTEPTLSDDEYLALARGHGFLAPETDDGAQRNSPVLLIEAPQVAGLG